LRLSRKTRKEAGSSLGVKNRDIDGAGIDLGTLMRAAVMYYYGVLQRLLVIDNYYSHWELSFIH